MASPKLNIYMLRDYLLGEQISSHDGVVCYPAIKRGTEEKYIVKVLSIPASQSKLEALLLAGAMSGKEAALNYFMGLAKNLEKQTDILRSLSQQEGFAPYLDCHIAPMEGDVGYHVYLLGTYKRSLERIFASDTMTHADVTSLGLDLCAALAACRRMGYLYTDLKPGNIFRDPEHGFRIGDVGFVNLASVKYASLPEQYRSSYTAPEMQDQMAVLNTTVDIYALGLVLYQAYNGGVLPFSGNAPSEELAPPMYADYEMAHIILKACHPDPLQRWEDPTKMAQALIDYLQHFGAPEEPIIPPVMEMPEEEETPDEEPFLPEADEEELQQEIADLDNADPDELAFMAGLVSDETAPSEEDASMSEDGLSEELSLMLAQADELIDHELPEPPVAPDPIFVPMPEPIPLEEDEPEQTDPKDSEVAELTEEPAEAEVPAEVEAEAQEEAAAAEAEEEPATAEEDVSSPALTEKNQKLKKEGNDQDENSFRFPWRIVGIAAAILLVIFGFIFGRNYYENEYLLQVQSMVLDQQNGILCVEIAADIEEGLLYVVCTDSYGNTLTRDVTGGVAVFSELKPGTRYTVQLEVRGNHKLVGKTSDSFSTPEQVQIHSFVAEMGPEDRSVSLNFTASGPETENWIVRYSAEGIEPKSLAFTGHCVVIRDLVEGKKYTFTLFSDEGLYLAGKCETEFVACNILYAQNLTITACGGGRLTAQWQPTEDGNVQQWRVRCFNEAGYEQTILTTDLSYTFAGLDHSTACTVEVTAVGMPKGVSTSISANPVSIVDFRCSFTEDMALQVQWLPVSQIHITDWILRCDLGGGRELVLQLQEPRALMLALPGQTYKFTLETAEGNFVFNAQHEYTTAEVFPFTGYGLNLVDLSHKLYVLPEGNKWKPEDFPEGSHVEQLLPGQQAALVIMSGIQPEASENPTIIRFILHDGTGKLMGVSEITAQWEDLWQEGFCILPIPILPEAEGEYILTVYFDDMFVLERDFSILPPPVVEDPEIQEPTT